MHKYRIRLDTLKDAERFAYAAQTIPERVVVKDNDGHCVNGKSLLGTLYAMEFTELWCETDSENSYFLMPFLVYDEN